MSGIESLPREVQRLIFSFVDEPANTGLVCKQWFEDTRDFLGMLRLFQYRQIALLIPQITAAETEIVIPRDLKIGDIPVDTLESARAKKVFQQVIASFETIPERIEAFERSKAIGSCTSAPRLEFIAEWTQEEEAKNFIAFIKYLFADVHPNIATLKQNFSQFFDCDLDIFISGNLDSYLPKANEIRQWMQRDEVQNLLKGLEALNLSEIVALQQLPCILTHLPKEIAYLSDLAILFIHRPIRIPDCSLLPNVELISISKIHDANDFNLLMQDLSLLPNLTDLDIHDCNLSDPVNLALLKQLDSLSLNATNLETIPQEVMQLSNLRYLDLSQNQISNIPEEIYNLKKLLSLDLQGNLFNAFPMEALSAPILFKINLENNPLTSIPSIEEIAAPLRDRDSHRIFLRFSEPLLHDEFGNPYSRILISCSYYKDVLLPMNSAKAILSWRNPEENESALWSIFKRIASGFCLLGSMLSGIGHILTLPPIGLIFKALLCLFPQSISLKLLSAACLDAILPALAETIVVGYAFIQNFYKDTISLQEIEEELSQIPWIESQLQSYFVLYE
jgi:hypothetical protein